MKFQINVELTDSEIKELATDVACRGVVQLIKQAGDQIDRNVNPEFLRNFMQGLMPLMEKIQGQRVATHAPSGPACDECGEPIAVVPLTSPKECFPISGPSIVPGWGCCKCRTYNGLQRTACRNCAHTRCGAAVTHPVASAGVGPIGAADGASPSIPMPPVPVPEQDATPAPIPNSDTSSR